MSEPLRLFLDEDTQIGLGVALKKRGIDVVHAQMLDRKGLKDAEQLAYAIQDRRCLVTYNVKDFVRLHNTYVQGDQEHWGILVSPQRSIGEALRRVLRLLQQYDRTSMKNRLEFF